MEKYEDQNLTQSVNYVQIMHIHDIHKYFFKQLIER